MSSNRTRKFVDDVFRSRSASQQSAVLESGASVRELKELLRRERLRVAHVQANCLRLQVENDYLDRTVTLLRTRLVALEGSLVSKRTYSNIERMIRLRSSGAVLKELHGAKKRKAVKKV